MSHPITEQDRQAYEQLLAQIKARVDFALASLAGSPSVFALEGAALQLRKSIELVALGSLVTNRAVALKVSSALASKGWNEARKLLRGVNARYWPTPSRQVHLGPSRFENQPVTDPYLREEEAGREWGYLSELLHAVNPFRQQPDLVQAVDRLRDIASRLVVLLSHHEIQLSDTRYLAIAAMNVRPGGQIQVTLFERTEGTAQ